MKKWINILHMLLACVGFTTVAYAQPPNDACGAATPITVGVGSCNSILYTNVAATSAGDPATPACWNPASLSHSVWFTFVATFTDIEVNTNFGGTLANTQLAVYSGTCGSLTQIACQENINAATGLFHTDIILRGLTIGNTYYLLVDGNGNTTGTFGICAQETLPLGPPLPTQDCVGAQALCSLSNIVVPNGPGGTGSSVESPSCFGAPGERSSNWYTFTAATSGTLQFSIMPNTVIDYDFAVYNTTTSCPGTELVCNWSDVLDTEETGLGCGDLFQCESALSVVAGQTYTILVDRYTAASTSGFTMSFAGTTASFSSPTPTFTAPAVCQGTPTIFTNTTNGNYTYNWNFGDGFTSNLENPTHTYATGGSYTVTLLLTTVPGGCQNATTQSVTVTPLPTVDAGIGGTVCPGNCLVLNGSTNATGSVGPLSFSNNADYNIPDDDTTGVSSLITVSGAFPTVIGATSISSVCLNIDHDFDADLDIFLQCPDGTRIRLSADNGGAGTDYIGTCFIPSGSASITTGTAPFTGSYVPEQAFSLLNGCTANGVWQLFVRDDGFGDLGTIRDWTITFNNNLPAFTWSPTTAMTNATTLSPTVCPTVNTTYTLTANNTNGCSASDTVTVNYTTTVTPVISCGILTPTTVQFNWLSLAGSGATSYIISYQINSNPIVNPGNIGNLLTCTINSLTPGDNVTITVTPVGGAGTCFAPASLTCTASACIPPAVPTISTTAPTCAADGFTAITNYSAANTYTFSPAGPVAGAGGTITGTVIGTAYTITATNGGCTSAASAAFTNLIRLTTPVVPTVTTSAPTCAADGFTTITNYSAANTYTFSPAGPVAGAGGTITGAVIGTPYTITATNGGCTSVASTAFTNLIRLTTPAVPTISTTAPTCAADGFTTITNYNAANTYTFSPAGPTAGAGGTITGAVIGTPYTITATSGGCTSVASSAFTNLIRLTTPAVPTISTTAPTCVADGFTTITNYSAANTYTFSPAGPTAGAGGTITGAVIGTPYTITTTNGGCTSAASTAFTNLIRLTTPAVPTISTTAPTCAADGFTTITNYNAANTYTFSPVGPSAGAGGTITGAVIGTPYTITATNGGCTSASSAGFTNLIRLTTPAVPTITTTAPTCAADGFTTITNYSAANTYIFSPVGPTAGAGGTITGAVIGTPYTITSTNGGCTSVASAPFTNLIRLTTPAVPTISTTAPTCAADGFTTITNYSAANTYTFSPAGPTAGAGGTITGAVIGTAYTITATSGGCTSAASAAFTNLIRLTTPAVPTISTTAPTCAADGFTTITNYNAANTYNFSPAGPTAGAGGTITGAVIGTAYTITATNGGCTSAASAAFTNLIRLTTPAVPTITTTAPTCAADGFTAITNYSAANTYTFSPAGPTAGAGGTITGAVIGTPYTITATNGGCTSVASTVFTNLIRLTTPALPTISTTAPTCAADGFTAITNYSAANTYTFSPAGPTAGAGGTITGAVIGTPYTITATNGGCTSVASTAFTNLIRLTTPAVPTISTTAPTCAADGFTTITNYSAANTYTFSPAGPTAGAGGTITGAVIGTPYTITATSGGCTSASSAGFTNLIQLVNLATPTLTTTAPTCAADGFTTITNYNPAYTYSFTPSGPIAGAGGTITGAIIGTAYTVIATQGVCSSTASTAFNNLIRLTTPAVPTISTTAPTCAADGFTTITNYSAANTYTFSPAGPTAGAGGTITGAVIGTLYTITATSGGCTSASSAGFTNLIRLTTPAVPTIPTTAPTCAADGFTTITNYSAANTYTFSPAGPTAGAGGTITGAVIGTAYTITATNGGCTSAFSAGFTNLIRLTTPAVPTISTTAPTCAADGFTTITNYSAANTYTFSPAGPTAGAGGTITGAVIGTAYTITATNGGCTSVASTAFTNLIRLTTPAVPTISTTVPTCAADGFTTITNYSAVNTYTFSPAGPVAGAGGTITGAVIGILYTITATNGGCTSASSAGFTNLIRLTTPAVPTITTTVPTCAADGFTTITNYSAANTYTFSPAGPTAGAGGTITGAVIGTPYTITATNGGCTSVASTVFTNLIRLTTPVVPTISTTAPTCAADGFTTITNYSATNTYTFSPAGPTAGAGGTITGAVIGTAYTITATSGGCTSASSSGFTNLARLGIPAIPLLSTTPPTCTANGFTTITNYDPAATYTFIPSGPSAGAGGIITGTVIGTAYTVTSTKSGCTSAASAPFTNSIMLVTPAVPTLSTTAPTCSNDGFSVITNYNPAHVYTFSPIGPIAGLGGSISGAVVGTAYTVTATSGGCTSVASASFTNAPLLFNVSTTSPPPLHYCDPNNDGFGTFDLTQLIPTITGGNPYVVTFHETPDDANIGGTTIPTPNNYDTIDVDTQTIYIRVSDNVTGCFAIIPLQLVVDKTPEAIEPNDYHVCDNDSDGLANFDLTSVASEVFGSINQATHTISYYTSLGDAQLETNPIINLIAFPSSGQTIWIRVENNATGCFDIVTLELIVDPLPLATQPNYPQYSLCDVTLPLAYEEFDLGSKIDDILLSQNGMNVTFHFSQADASNDINPLPLLYTNAVPFVQTIWIRVENAITGCFVLSTMDIRVEPLPTPIPPNQVYSICDTNQDGFGTFNLNSLTTDILQGANYTISYHETYDDAQFGNNALVSPYDNVTAFVQFIYVLAVDNVNGCRNIIPIELNVYPQPITPFTIPNLEQCDEDTNPQNGSMLFDLTQNDLAVLTIQPLAPTNYTVTYHISHADAINGVPAIIQSTNYVGTNNEIIWVRVENNATGCFSIGSFQLLINAPLVLPIPIPLSVCDADAVPNNQYTEFDLTVKNNEITGGQPVSVTYYPSYPVTASSVAIPNPTNYTNILPAVQTLGVMVTTSQGCRSYTSLDIRVLPIPTPNLAGIRPLTPQCDVNNTGDMLEIFDLTVNAANIINGDPTLTLHYFPTQADAIGGTNEILIPTVALVGQNVWIRVENNRVDYLGENCFVLVEQPLTVNPLPATIPNTVVQNCDDDTDGQTAFDLTATTAAFYGTANLTVTYYTTANDAQFGTNAITNPTAYLNTGNPQIIYIRVVDNVTGCVNYNGQFTITVNPKPTATAPANFATCDTDGTNDGFFTLDLSTYISGVIGAQTGVTTTFYNTQNDATNATNAITDLVNYQTYTHTIWIRVQDDTTGCYQLVSFNSTVEELAEPNITSPSDTICVEFGTNILLSGLTLDSGITNPNYTFEWFEATNPTTVLGTGPTYTISTVAPGDYTVVATSTSPLGCVSNPAALFTVIQSGPAQFATPPYTVSNAFDDNQVITINVGGFGLYEYSLDDGPFQSSNIFEHVALGEHTVTVKDVKGNTSCGEISLDEIQTINYPHYFTPNGDGFNDTWNVVGLQNQLGTKLYIFDRYGKLLKQLSTGGEGWDGTLNGHQLPSTDYWFKIEYVEQSQVKEFKSHFSLKR